MIHKLVKKLKKSRQGFTLIELIVVIAILGILAAVLVPTITNSIATAKTNAGKSDAQAAFTAAQLYVADHPDAPLTPGTFTSETATPISTMEGSSEFATLRANSDFHITNLVVGTDGTVTSITISSSNGTGLKYPIGSSSVS